MRSTSVFLSNLWMVCSQLNNKKNNECEVVLRMEVATKGVATDGKTFYTKIDSITDKFLMNQTRRFF